VQIRNGWRDELANSLLQQGIYTTVRFHPLHFSRVYGAAVTLPVTERLADVALNLPLHPRLSDSDVERVIDAVRRFGQ
jgi:aminotransferase